MTWYFNMANNFIHHGRRACESRHFWDLDFITHRIQITEKTVKIRLTLLNFVLSLRKTIIFQKCRNLIWNRHLWGCLRAMLHTVCWWFHCFPRSWKFHPYFIRSAILSSTISDEVPRQNSRLHWKAVPRSSRRNLNQLSKHQLKVSFEGKNMTHKPFIAVPTTTEKRVKHLWFPKPVTSGNADEMKDL